MTIFGHPWSYKNLGQKFPCFKKLAYLNDFQLRHSYIQPVVMAFLHDKFLHNTVK